MPQREINIEPTARPTPGPAAGWADAYREILETLWADVSADPDDLTDVHQAPEVAALVAFAAEIRAGITAGLLSSGLPEAEPVRVPLVGSTRHEQPTRPADHLPVRDPEDERILRGGFNPAAEPINPNR